jgi:hypothetical protein
MVRDTESGQLRERHVFNMTKKGSKNQSLSDTDGVTVSLQPYKPPPGLHLKYTRFFSTRANIANRAICISLKLAGDRESPDFYYLK